MPSEGRTGHLTTPPDNGGSIGVLFVIEKQDFQRGTRQVAAELSKIERQSISKKGYRKDTFSINVESTGESLGEVAVTQIRAWDKALEDSANDWGKMIAAAGKERFREVIKSAPNRTKRSGRIDTGDMLKAVRGVTKSLKNETRIAIGWNTEMIGTPGTYYRYFSFQEDGTSNGPTAMGAVPKTAAYITTQFDKSFGRMLEYRMKNIK